MGKQAKSALVSPGRSPITSGSHSPVPVPAETTAGIRSARLPLGPITVDPIMFWPFLNVDADLLAIARGTI